MVVSSDRNIWIFLAMAIADLGIRGVAVAFVGLLPQAFFMWLRYYGAAFVAKTADSTGHRYVIRKIRIKQAVESVVFYGVAVILVIGGVFAEAYINIPLLKMIVKIFEKIAFRSAYHYNEKYTG